jgi:hypothetical protein
MGSIPLFKTVDTGTAKAVKLPYFLHFEGGMFLTPKLFEIRPRLTFDGIKESVSKCYTVRPKCKAHLHIYNTSHETGNPEIATRDIKNIATCGEV